VLSFLAELLLDPSGLFDGVRDGRRERRIRQRALAAGIPCTLRVVDGDRRGLRRRWTRGAARVPPGALIFEPNSGWRPRMTIPVRSATLQPPWDRPGRTPRAIGPQPRLIVVTTARATLEWLVPEEQLQRAMGVTHRSVRDARTPTE
jgi:hypothetical protein